MKIKVAPLSAMPCKLAMSMANNRGAKLTTCLILRALVAMIMLGHINWVGFRGAETKYINLFARSTSAPPCHMGVRTNGKCVL